MDTWRKTDFSYHSCCLQSKTNKRETFQMICFFLRVTLTKLWSRQDSSSSNWAMSNRKELLCFPTDLHEKSEKISVNENTGQNIIKRKQDLLNVIIYCLKCNRHTHTHTQSYTFMVDHIHILNYLKYFQKIITTCTWYG